jgi:hypothetical protein
MECRVVPTEPYYACKQCNVFHYCSPYCREVAANKHYFNCRLVRDAERKVITEKAALVDVLGRDVFEANTGNLWPTVEGRPYCRALRDLAELYEQIGWKEENRVCLSMAAIYYNRLLVENRGDHQCIRLVYPFSLMSLSKFQISYNVLR